MSQGLKNTELEIVYTVHDYHRLEEDKLNCSFKTCLK